MNRTRKWLLAAVVAWFLVVCGCLVSLIRWESPEPEPVVEAAPVAQIIPSTAAAEPDPDLPIYHQEAKPPYTVPLDADLQRHIIGICMEYDVDALVVFAIIEQESEFDAAAIGDGGESEGLMQIQERWHGERMERLGVSDLTDPYQNVVVGVDFLAELLDKYSLEQALTAYNSGNPGQSEYAAAVMGRMEEYLNEED